VNGPRVAEIKRAEAVEAERQRETIGNAAKKLKFD